MPQKKSLKILVTAEMAVGHVNACINVMKHMMKRGHQVAFLIDETYRGKLEPMGFQEFYFNNDSVHSKNPGQDLSAILLNEVFREPDLYKQLIKCMGVFRGTPRAIKMFIEIDKRLKQIISEFDPDLIYNDRMALSPAIYYSGKKWIDNVSTVPLCYLQELDEMPPACSGLGLNSDKKEWKRFKDIFKSLGTKMNELIVQMGYEPYPENVSRPKTMEMVVYACPQEYNYPGMDKLEKWFNIEVFYKYETENMKIDLKQLVPAEFYDDTLNGNWSGKWIYVSLGTMGSADMELMHKLIEILGRTNHKYIVSKGPRHNEYELVDNMWGDRYLPQTKIIPSMDLVITHGGNNSVTEIFAQGKPMIILPLFGDQYDNAVRLDETNYGLRLKTYDFTEHEMNRSIERLLNDDDLKMRLMKASQRILSSNKHDVLCDIMESL